MHLNKFIVYLEFGGNHYFTSLKMINMINKYYKANQPGPSYVNVMSLFKLTQTRANSVNINTFYTYKLTLLNINTYHHKIVRPYSLYFILVKKNV